MNIRDRFNCVNNKNFFSICFFTSDQFELEPVAFLFILILIRWIHYGNFSRKKWSIIVKYVHIFKVIKIQKSFKLAKVTCSISEIVQAHRYTVYGGKNCILSSYEVRKKRCHFFLAKMIAVSLGSSDEW